MKKKGLIGCFPSNTKFYQVILSAGKESSFKFRNRLPKEIEFNLCWILSQLLHFNSSIMLGLGILVLEGKE